MLVNQKIAALRKEKGLSMTELAEATGIGQTSISRYEHGKIKKIEPDKLSKIASALNVSVEELTKDDPVYISQTVRGPYAKKNESITVQDDFDKELLFTFHQMSDVTKASVLQLCHIIASCTN